MKKIFLSFGLFLAIIFLAGCGQKNVDLEKVAPAVSSQKDVDSNMPDSLNQANISDVKNSENKSQIVLPETISVQPGITPDDEIENIDKDIQSMSVDDFKSDDLSDENLGL